MNTMTMDQAMSGAAQSNLQAQTASLNALSSNSANDAEKRKKLGEAAEGFEALFIQQMWEEMRSSLPKDGLFTSSKEEQFWQGIYDQELGKHMASAGGIGLADMMVEQLDAGVRDVARAKNMPNRPGGLEIAPAPMFDLDMIREKKAAEQAMTISQTEDAINLPTNSPMPINAAFTSGRNAQNPTNTNLYEEVAEDMAMQIPPVPAKSASEVVSEKVASTVAQVNTNSPTLKANDEALAEPVVTQVTYQTNATTQNAQRNSRNNNNIVDTILADARQAYREHLNEQIKTQGIYEEMPANTVVQNTQIVSQPAQVPTAPIMLQPVASHEPEDILSGITTTYQKGRHLRPVEEVIPQSIGTGTIAQTRTVYVEDTRTVPSLAARAMLQPNSAGGPDLLGPQPIVKTMDLGFLNPERGSMADPVEGGKVTSGFGWRLDPLNGKRSWHNGLDIKAEEGTPVLAVDSGKVTFSGVDKEFGNMVVIEHANGLQTIYGHNGSLSVKVGDTIEKGMEIATVGSTGRAIGAHLHFEIRKADLPINPEHVLTQYFNEDGVRIS